MMQRGQRPLGLIPRQIGYPLSFRGQVCGTQGSLPCFSSMGLCARRLPFLERVPVSPVPRLPRYYEAATTSRGACPLAYDFALGFRTCLVLRARSRAPNRYQAVDWAWSIVQPVAPGRRFHTDTHGTSQVPWRPIPYLCPALRPRPNRLFLAIAAFPMLPPDPTRRRLQHFHDFEANHRALVPAVYASRTTLPPPMQDSLPAGGLRLYREGSNPLGHDERFQVTSVLLSRTYPDASRVDEEVATLVPHRPGRADYPHPVLHAQASLT
jgi:hypothetical protein